MSKSNFANYRMATGGAHSAIHSATRAAPPPIEAPDPVEQAVIVIGSLEEGIDIIVGPFASFDAAHEYADAVGIAGMT